MLHAALGHRPTVSQLRTHTGLPQSQVERHFNSYAALCHELGMDATLRTARWTRAEIIAAGLAHHTRTGSAPTARSWVKAAADHPSAVTVRTHWREGWAAFIAELDIPTASLPTRRIWTEDLILGALVRHAREHGTWPRSEDWQRRGEWWPSARSVRSVMGSWNAGVARAAASIDESYERAAPERAGKAQQHRRTRAQLDAWSQPLIIRAAQQWRAETGAWPSAKDWRSIGEPWPSHALVRRTFVSWDAMLDEAGRERTRRTPVIRRGLAWHTLQRIFERDGHHCQNPYCDGICDRLTADHIVAVACGGNNDDDNLQTLCMTCNSRKGKHSQEAFETAEVERRGQLAAA